APDIGIDRPAWDPVGDRGDRAGGVWADPRQALERRNVGREHAAHLADEDSGRALQVHRSPVVAESPPGPQDASRRRRRKRFDGRELPRERHPGGSAARDLCLLEQGLRDEDEVWVGGPPKRKGSPTRVKPRQDGPPERGDVQVQDGHAPSYQNLTRATL